MQETLQWRAQGVSQCTFYGPWIESFQQSWVFQHLSVVWNGSNQDCKALQSCALPSLQDIYLKRCKSRAVKIIKDSNHPGNRLFILLPSGKCFRSMRDLGGASSPRPSGSKTQTQSHNIKHDNMKGGEGGPLWGRTLKCPCGPVPPVCDFCQGGVCHMKIFPSWTIKMSPGSAFEEILLLSRYSTHSISCSSGARPPYQYNVQRHIITSVLTLRVYIKLTYSQDSNTYSQSQWSALIKPYCLVVECFIHVLFWREPFLSTYTQSALNKKPIKQRLCHWTTLCNWSYC